MGLRALFSVGETVTASVMGVRDKLDADGNTEIKRSAAGVDTVQKEEFPLRAPFTGKVIQVSSQLEGDGPAHRYKVECPHPDRAGAMWVEEKHLAAAPAAS